jgi:beta-galactosidase/beta-glucuronidase
MWPFAYYFVLGVLLAHGQAGNPPSISQVAFSPGTARVTTSLDADWRFLKGDAAGAEAPSFDDTKWRALSVPHDWSIEGPFDAENATGGAGIYRHVRLVITDSIHIVQWGTFITTPQIDAAQATVRGHTSIVNQSGTPRDISLQIMIISPDGRSVGTATSQAQRVGAGQSVDFEQEIAVKTPRLWDLDHPNLYSAYLIIKSGRDMLDDERVTFGIRDARFEPSTGFALNGKHLKIKGVCLHHDGGALGAAVPLGVWEYRLKQLRTLGVNAIRTAHNPPAPEFLDLCDRMGFLVMDEMFDCWTVAKNPYDYHLYFNEWSKIDTRDTVRRDRNHPSIILYSAGNEIRDTQGKKLKGRDQPGRFRAGTGWKLDLHRCGCSSRGKEIVDSGQCAG